MSTTIKKINFYQKYAAEHLALELDDKGLFCKVLSERIEGLSYRVEMNEETMTAIRCQCFSKRPCKHMRVVTEAFAYKASEGFCEVEAGRWYIVNSDTQVWLQDGKWIGVGPTENAVEIVEAYLEKQKEVTPVVEEAVVEMPAQPVVETAPVAVQQYQMSQGVRERLAAIAKPVEVAPVAVKPKWNNSAARWEDPTTGKPAAMLGGVPYWNETDGFLAHPEGKEWNDWTMQWEAPVEPVKATCRVIPNSTKRERYDLVGELTARREMKQETLGEIAAIRERSMMNAALTSNQGFQLMR